MNELTDKDLKDMWQREISFRSANYPVTQIAYAATDVADGIVRKYWIEVYSFYKVNSPYKLSEETRNRVTAYLGMLLHAFQSAVREAFGEECEYTKYFYELMYMKYRELLNNSDVGFQMECEARKRNSGGNNE